MQATHQSELQCRNVESAALLMELALEDSQTVEQVLADLAASLAQESAAVAQAIAAVDTPAEIAKLRAQFVGRVAALMVEGSHRLADVGGATRARFSRLLTERLASGRGELLDAYQAFFSVLPSQQPDAVATMRHALLRSDRAVEDALRLVMPPVASACAPVPAPMPAPSDLSLAVSSR